MKGKGAAASSLDRSHGLRKGRLPDYPVVNTIGTSGGSRGAQQASPPPKKKKKKKSLIDHVFCFFYPVYQNASE